MKIIKTAAYKKMAQYGYPAGGDERGGYSGGRHYSDDDDMLGDVPFMDPGGHSALRAGERIFPCPTCKRPNMLTQADKDRHYQCDHCADAAEGRGWPGD